MNGQQDDQPRKTQDQIPTVRLRRRRLDDGRIVLEPVALDAA